MNGHEIERIAAALNQLRPDWPVKQLHTLMAHPSLADRPRRDVSVALTWVACDASTANPYRVLEAGPWWRAVAVESGPTGPIKRGPLCVHCGFEEHDCKRRWATDHKYQGPDDWMRRRPNTDVAATVHALRELVVDAKAEPTTPTPRAEIRGRHESEAS